MAGPIRPEQWPRVRELFEGALDKPVAERGAYLNAACATDPELREHVTRMLDSHDRAADFLDTPVGIPAIDSASTGFETRRLGPYQLLSRLGAGGMGVVYKAQDPRLDRTVAIKVLPSHVATDPQSRERFEREARAVAALSHPHICALYDIGRHDEIDFLVMEYLDGETLEARLARGPLPIDRALEYATSIASAFDTAHRAGIVHRDFKPANVMLTKTGAKLLDFGLAKTIPAVASMDRSATRGRPDLTTPGMILGTVQYMAPEQLAGQTADARTDIFAFGAVLFEILSGRKAFDGDSPASLIAAILEREPPRVSSLQPAAPHALDRVICACLAKDPDDRWQTMRDLLRELQWIADARSETPTSADLQRRARNVSRWSVSILAVTAVAALVIGAAAYIYRPTVREPFSTTFEIQTPATSEPLSFALSPDGQSLTFVATVDGASRLLVRYLDQVTTQALAGTEGAVFPFYSPDGLSIGFFADGKLKIVDVSGGLPRVLADAPNGRGGAWSRDGIIIFAPGAAGVLKRVPASGGTPAAVTQLVAGQTHRWPQFLPDGRHFLYVSAQGSKSAQGLFVGSLDSDQTIRVLNDETAATFVPPGMLLLLRRGALVALPFDPVRARVIGDALPVAQSVGWDETMVRGAFAASPTGTLAYRTGLAVARQLVWFDRAGTVRGTVGPADESAPAGPEVSPDARRAAIYRTVSGNTDVWLLEVGRGVLSRFTFEDQVDILPVWSPDGERIVFGSNRNGSYDLFEKAANGVGEERPVLEQAVPKTPLGMSPDGRFLLYAMGLPKTGVDLWALPLAGDRKPFPVVQTPYDEMAGQFSPDGRWVAYQSNESGRVEVYVRPFPGPGGQLQVSQAGGTQARWRPDGKELFYIAPDSRLMAVSMGVARDGKSIDAGATTPLFITRLATGMNVFPAVGTKQQYAVAPDGRFLMNVPVEGSTAPPVTIVLNWEAALKRRAIRPLP